MSTNVKGVKKRKKEKWLMITIVIVLIITILFMAYIIYEEFIKNEELISITEDDYSYMQTTLVPAVMPETIMVYERGEVYSNSSSSNLEKIITLDKQKLRN